jgi:hypothetical protein
MAKSTKNAGLICAIVTLLAALGVAIGIWRANPLAVIILLFPAVIYEMYRTEGFYTKLAAIGMFALLVVLMVMLTGNMSLDLSPILAKFSIKAQVDAKLAAPAVIAILAVFLFRRTAGVYTKWLAVVIILAAMGLFYVIDPALFGFLVKQGTAEGAKRIK